MLPTHAPHAPVPEEVFSIWSCRNRNLRRFRNFKIVLVEPIRNSGTTAMNVSEYQTGFELERRDAAFAFAGMALLTSRSVVVPNRRV